LLNLLLDALESNHEVKVCFVSFDDPKERILRRMFALLARLSVHEISTASRDTESARKLDAAFDRLESFAALDRITLLGSEEGNAPALLRKTFNRSPAEDNRILFLDGLHLEAIPRALG